MYSYIFKPIIIRFGRMNNKHILNYYTSYILNQQLIKKEHGYQLQLIKPKLEPNSSRGRTSWHKN